MYLKYLIACFSYNCLQCSDEKVPTELKKAIMHARNEKKLTQAQLAQVFPFLSPEWIISNDMVATPAQAALASMYTSLLL